MTATAVLVIDTSVAVKCYVPEPGATAAAELLGKSYLLLAPDLVGPELGNVLWKKVRRGEITATEAQEVARTFVQAPPVRLIPSAAYLPAALDIAVRHERTVYDALYVALAVDRGGRYVTADERLVHALVATELAPFVQQLSG